MKFKWVKIKRSKQSPSQRIKRNVRGIQIFANMFLQAQERRRKIAEHDTKLKLMEQQQRVREIQLEVASDKLVLMDIEIERKKLELKELARKVNGSDDFDRSMFE